MDSGSQYIERKRPFYDNVFLTLKTEQEDEQSSKRARLNILDDIYCQCETERYLIVEFSHTISSINIRIKSENDGNHGCNQSGGNPLMEFYSKSTVFAFLLEEKVVIHESESFVK
eukprot:TRINITY_DN1497_c0_g1_i4.p1 TRINITY_DN1497_c0_g1~~TRINITY_DN1497_c0_g1_i4.p1  ORF type:complete len:115 (-),score=18.82 TRINITY_DN1497_c0_g1_i4:247-591(-)